MDRAQVMIDAGERGDYGELQWAYRLVERRDPIVCSLVGRYESGLSKLDWEIKSGVDSAEAREQVAALREAYEGLDNLREAIQWLALARFRGFAHLEKWTDVEGRVTHLEPVPQWCWLRDGVGGVWEYNRDGLAGIRTQSGERVERGRFVVREVDRPVDELGLVAHARRVQCQDGWDSFVGTYGVPAMFVIGPSGVSAEREAQLASMIEEVIGNYRGYLPYGTELVSVPTEARGVNPFRTFLRALDEQMVLAATGGKLSVLSEAGVGQQAGLVHWRVWREILQGEAGYVSETFQRDFDEPLLRNRFHGRKPLAYFELCSNEEQDAGAVVDHVVRLREAGLMVDAAQVSEKTGYRIVSGLDGRSVRKGDTKGGIAS